MVEIKSTECNFIDGTFIECNSIECSIIEFIEQNSIDTSNLNNQQLRLNKISNMENYIIEEIKEEN